MRRMLIPLVATLILVGAACGDGGSETPDSDMTTAADQQSSVTEPPDPETTFPGETQPPETETTGADESQTPDVAVVVAVEFDGAVCKIIEADPAYVASDDEDLDLLTASPGTPLVFLVTNTSGLDLTGVANRYDPSLSPSEAVALTRDLGVEDGMMYERPAFIEGPAASNLNAALLTIDENQLQYHYTLQPGVSNTIVYTQDGIWPCRTDEAEISLINVASD